MNVGDRIKRIKDLLQELSNELNQLEGDLNSKDSSKKIELDPVIKDQLKSFVEGSPGK